MKWNAALRHLLWKDWLLVRSLVFIVLALTVFFNLGAVALFWLDPIPVGHSILDLATSWLFIPSLVAFGAPVMLVGTEEESGTLGWMRSLPINWKTIAFSKILVSVLSLGLVTLASFAAYAAVIPILNALRTDGFFYSAEWKALPGSMWISAQLFLVTLPLAWLFKSPMVSIIAILPALVVLALLTSLLDEYLYLTQWMPIGVYFLLVNLLLLLIAYRAAKLRLGRKDKVPRAATIQSSGVLSPVAFNYASSGNSALRAKPTSWQALCWQSRRQQFWPTLALSICAIVCLSAIWKLGESESESFSIHQSAFMISLFVLAIVCTWLGCLCFYGDSVRQRFTFFADRGLTGMLFWLSRMWIPALAMIAIFIMSLFVLPSGWNWDPFAPSYLLVAFACGQMASMWISRRSMAFVLGPAFTLWLMILLNYPRYLDYSWLAIVPLLFATAFLTRPWLESRRGFAFHARLVGAIFLALMIVPIGIQIRRYVFIPAEMTQWRTEMLAKPMPAAFAQLEDQKQLKSRDYLAPWLDAQDQTKLKEDPHMKRFLTESDEITVDVLKSYYYSVQGNSHWDSAFAAELNSPDAAMLFKGKFDAWRSMLQWAKEARMAVIEGRMHPRFVLKHASADELMVINTISSIAETNSAALPDAMKQEVLAILDELASPELQKESWQTAMIMEWRLFQQRRTPCEYANHFEFVDANDRLGQSWEKRRIDRYVDQATRLSLEWTDQKRESWFSNWQLNNAWSHVYAGSYNHYAIPMAPATQQIVADIRLKIGAGTQSVSAEPTRTQE